MSNAKKQFDAVEMMRSIRDRISAQIQGMTLEEEREWLASQELKDPFLRRIRDKAAQQGAAAAGAARHR
jgi:FtsZ-interacting cell division protein ZipA